MQYRTLLFLLLCAATACSAPATSAPPVGVRPCSAPAPSQADLLPINALSEDGRTWGPRFRVQAVRATEGALRVAILNGRIERVGEASVRILIDADGRTRDSRLLRNSGSRALGEVALEIARALRFHPAQRDGCSVPAWVEYSVDAADGAQPQDAGRRPERP